MLPLPLQVLGNCVAKGSVFSAVATNDKGTPALAFIDERSDKSYGLKFAWMKSAGKWQVSGDILPSLDVVPNLTNRRAMTVLPAGAGWPETVVLAVVGYPTAGNTAKTALYLVAYAPSTGKGWAQKLMDLKSSSDPFELARSGTSLVLGESRPSVVARE